MAFINHSNDHDGIMISNSIRFRLILKEHVPVLIIDGLLLDGKLYKKPLCLCKLYNTDYVFVFVFNDRNIIQN